MWLFNRHVWLAYKISRLKTKFIAFIPLLICLALHLNLCSILITIHYMGKGHCFDSLLMCTHEGHYCLIYYWLQ